MKTQAREHARAAMQERIAREQRIQDQAELFFQKTLGRENEKEALREKTEQLQQQLKELDAPAPECAEHVAALKTKGLNSSEIADVFGVSGGAVSRYLKPVPDSAGGSSPASSGEAGSDV